MAAEAAGRGGRPRRSGSGPGERSCSPAGGPGLGREGFALALVVFLLFAIGLAGTLGYQAVRTEAALSLTNQQGSEAFTAAHAGLQRFMAEAGDTVVEAQIYSVLDAEATVTARQVYGGPFPNRRYLIRSVGTFLDPRFSENAVERTVYMLADHQRVPVALLGALVSPSEDIRIDNLDSNAINGRDIADTGECPEAGTNVDDIVGGGSIEITRSGGVRGTSYPGAQAVMDSSGIDWSVLIDPTFPVEHDDVWPNFQSIPADSFPVIRMTSNNFDANQDRIGRGLLIVTGELRLGDDFEWDGLILAHEMRNRTNNQQFVIRGSLVVGLDTSGDRFEIQDAGEIYFHSCNVVEASRGLAHLEPLSGTWWEAF